MPDALVVETMRRFKAQLRAQEEATMREMAQRWLGVERSLSSLIDDLVLQLDAQRRDGLPVTQAALFRLDRYQALLLQLGVEWRDYQDYSLETVDTLRTRAGAAAIDQAVDLLEAVQPGVGATFRRLPREAIENAVGLVGRGPLRELLAARAVEAAMADGLTQSLIQGVALGRNPRRVAREMRDSLAGGLNKALTIARTEQLRVYREMQRQQWAEAGVVEGYYRLATHDDRVCPACLARDGEFIPLGETMAEHPQGRCAQVPAVVGFEPPAWTKGSQWFQAQSAATQRSILGPQRYDAWRRGEFDFADLATIRSNSVWGNSLQVTPLSQLVAGGTNE